MKPQSSCRYGGFRFATRTRCGETVRNYAKKLENDYVIKPKDALHLACAIQSKCNYFLTTDRVLLKKALRLSEIIAINPIDFVIVWEGK